MKKLTIIAILGIVLVMGFAIYALSTSSTSPSSLPREKEEPIEKMELYIERHSVSDVKSVFDKFIVLLAEPTTPIACRDGQYQGESIYDDYHYKHVVTLDIKDAKIIAIHYDEVKKEGKGKRGDQDYCTLMKKGSGASPAEAYPVYEASMLKHQDIMKIDAVSGATYSLYRFRTAVLRAMMAAQGK